MAETCKALVCNGSIEGMGTFVLLSMILTDDDNLLHLNAAYADRHGHDRHLLAFPSRQTLV